MSAIPHFLIIGAQKAGTTAAARNLALHPQIRIFSGITEYGQWEIEFFNQHWERQIPWYASHFQKSVFLNGEKTAELLHRTICHKRMHETNPHFRLLVLLRSPVDRAYSQWKMASLVKCDETEGFEVIIQREFAALEKPTYREHFYNCGQTDLSCWREGYLLKGMYAEQLESLFKWFPKDQIHIAITERIRSNLTLGYNKMFHFLGLQAINAQFGEHFIGRPSPPMSPQIRSLLSAIYRFPNERLYSLLGTDIPEWK